MDSAYVFRVPEDDLVVPSVSIGKLFFDVLQTKDPSEIVMVEFSTGEHITRKKLLQDSIKLSTSLRNLGIKHGDGLAIISNNSWKYVVSLISAFYVGATVTTINHNSSKDDLLHYLNISKPKLIFTSGESADKIRSLSNDLPFVHHIITYVPDTQNDELLFENLTSNDIDCTSFSLEEEYVEEALILYSSGTTGFPKGVMLTQTNFLAGIILLSCPKAINLAGQSILGFLPMFHIFGLYMTLGCVLCGRKNVIMEKFEPDAFLRGIEEHKITCLSVVPPLALFLAKSPLVHSYDLSSLKDVICGAAPLGAEVEEAVSKRLGVSVRQLYGLTETCIISCIPPGVQKRGSVGKVVPSGQVKIVDINGKIVGKNSVGEICFKGLAVMKGYIDNEEATRKCIDADGFMQVGDLGYFDDEEYLYIVDRIKDMIKYKGFQVSPVQLESILHKHPAIREAVIVGRPDERAGELPTALIVLQAGHEITKQEIINYVAERASPEKQLHGGVLFIKEIPKTASGKMLRKELKKYL